MGRRRMGGRVRLKVKSCRGGRGLAGQGARLLEGARRYEMRGGAASKGDARRVERRGAFRAEPACRA